MHAVRPMWPGQGRLKAKVIFSNEQSKASKAEENGEQRFMAGKGRVERARVCVTLAVLLG